MARVPWAFVSLCLMAACSSESPDAVADAAGDVTVDAEDARSPLDAVVDEASGCALAGGSCTQGCFAVAARRVDVAQACLGAAEIVACVGGVDGPTIFACVRGPGGVAWQVQASMVPTGSDWSACTAAEESLARSGLSPTCP